jgi:hypothetical protein
MLLDRIAGIQVTWSKHLLAEKVHCHTVQYVTQGLLEVACQSNTKGADLLWCGFCSGGLLKNSLWFSSFMAYFAAQCISNRRASSSLAFSNEKNWNDFPKGCVKQFAGIGVPGFGGPLRVQLKVPHGNYAITQDLRSLS